MRKILPFAPLVFKWFLAGVALDALSVDPQDLRWGVGVVAMGASPDRGRQFLGSSLHTNGSGSV